MCLICPSEPPLICSSCLFLPGLGCGAQTCLFLSVRHGNPHAWAASVCLPEMPHRLLWRHQSSCSWLVAFKKSSRRFLHHGCWCLAEPEKLGEWDTLGNAAVGYFTIASLQTPHILQPSFQAHLPTTNTLQGHHVRWVALGETFPVPELPSAVLCWLSCCREQVVMIAPVTADVAESVCVSSRHSPPRTLCPYTTIGEDAWQKHFPLKAMKRSLDDIIYQAAADKQTVGFVLLFFKIDATHCFPPTRPKRTPRLHRAHGQESWECLRHRGCDQCWNGSAVHPAWLAMSVTAQLVCMPIHPRAAGEFGFFPSSL